jgi:hypothetical protein
VKFKALLKDLLEATDLYTVDGFEATLQPPEKEKKNSLPHYFILTLGYTEKPEWIDVKLQQEVEVDATGKASFHDTGGNLHHIQLWKYRPLTLEDVRQAQEANHLPG